MISFKNILIAGMMGCAFGATATSCQENEYGSVDLSGYKPAPKVTLTYNHPCALYSAADFARVRKAIADGTLNAAQQEEFNALKSNRYVTGDYGVVTHEHQQIVRGDPTGTIEGVENAGDAMKDAAAAHQFGMLWQLTKNEEYAKKGIKILNAWVAVCKEVTANDNHPYLVTGSQGFTFALAGELLRDYSGWSESQFTEYKNWMLDVFGTKNYKFLMLHGSSNCGSPKHYMSNWELVNLCSYLQIGILTENEDIINFVTSYFTKTGEGFGAIPNLLQATYDITTPAGVEKVAQAQESGRDQGHATMAMAVVANLCQSAWALYEDNPERTDLDYFSTNDYAVLHMAEYNCMANLKTGTHADITISGGSGVQGGEWVVSLAQIPFTPVGKWCPNPSHEAGKMQMAFGEKDRGCLRPGFEIYNKHYKNTSGSYYIKKYAEVNRPECGSGDDRYGQNSGAFDQIGWGTLMLYQE